jgi:hypothetical protein
MRVAIHEYGGIVPSDPVDAFSSSEGSSTNPDSGKVTTSHASELIFAASADGGTPVWSTGTGFTLRQTPANILATKDQIVSSAGTFAGTFLLSRSDHWSAAVVAFKGRLPADSNMTNNATEQQRPGTDTEFARPNPYVDLRLLGGRIVNPNIPPAIPGITATTTSGNKSVSISSASTFHNFDHVTIWNAGAPSGLTTPGAPTVTPSVASGPTGTGMVVDAPSGSTTYQYQCAAVKLQGGYTAAGTATSITTGSASLGYQSAKITSLSKTNNVVTGLTASAHGLSVGAMIQISNTTDSPDFGGWYLVSAVADNTHFTYVTPGDTRGNSLTSAAGGTLGWFNVNHVTCPAVQGADYYALYGRTSGGMALIGLSKLQDATAGITDPVIDDFGSTMMGNPAMPAYFPAAPPSAGANDHLTTQIRGGAGTATLFLEAAPAVTGTETILFDDGPVLAKVPNFTNIMLPVGAGSTIVNSYTPMPSNTNIYQAGTLQLNATLQLGNSTNWFGQVIPQGCSVTSFANFCAVGAFIKYWNSFVFQPSSGNAVTTIKGINFQGPNNSIHVVLDAPASLAISDCSFTGAGGAEALTMPLLVRNGQFQIHFYNVTMLGSQSGNSMTPLFFCNRCGTFQADWFNLSGRGVAYNGSGLRVNWGRKQGGTAPFLTMIPLTSHPVGGVTPTPFLMPTIIDNYELDTDANPLIANLTPTSTTVPLPEVVLAGGIPSPSHDSGGPLPLISGQRFPSLTVEVGSANTGGFNNGLDVENVEGFYGLDFNGHPTYGVGGKAGMMSQKVLNKNLNIGAGNGLTLQMFSPIPVATVSTSCGGSFPRAGAYSYQTVAVGADGVLAAPSFVSNRVVLNGTTQCTQLNWTDIPNVQGYRILSNGGLLYGEGAGNCNSYSTFVQANKCVDNKGTAVGMTPNMNGSGDPSFYPRQLTTSKIVLGSQSGKYGTNTITGSFTNSWHTMLPDGNGSVPVVASLTTTAASSDSVSIKGATSSSHCTLTPTNASAAADSTGTYVSSKTTNQITVAHPASAGRTWDITCTAN